jgi:hypothetical protein
MADAIGSVRATFTASVGGMTGAIDQVVGKLGGFAAAQRKVAADTTRFESVTKELSSEFLRGGGSVDTFGTKLGNTMRSFTRISEAERTRIVLEALEQAFEGSGRGAAELADAQAKAAAVIRAGTSPIERLSVDLAKNRADFLAGKISADQYRQTIATLPGQINGTETAMQKMERVFKQAQETVRGLRTPTDELQQQLAELKEQEEAGAISDQQYAQAKGLIEQKLRELTPEFIAAKAAEEELNKAMERGKAVTESLLTPQQQYERNVAELDELLSKNAITAETHAAGIRKEKAALDAADPAMQELNRAMEDGKAITQAMLTPTEKYEEEIKKLDGLLAKNAISEETHARATKKAKDELDKAGPAAKSVGDAFGGLPGPLGAAARAFDMMQKSMGGTIAGFRSGGIRGGISTFVGQIREGVANAGSTGGASLIGIAPQIGLVAAAAYAGVQGLKMMAEAMGAVGERVERTGQLAERMGVSFQEFEVLAVAANMAGVETEALASAQTKGLKAISAARAGAKEQALAFSALGISQRQLQESNPSALLEDAARKLNAIEDPATRATLAMKIFGKAGNDVLPALAGIDSVREGIQRLGGVMNEGDVGRFKALDDAFDNATRATTRLGETLLAPFTGLFQTIAEGVAATFGGFASALAPISPLLDGILKPIGFIVQLAGEGLGLFGRFVGATISGIYEIVAGVVEIVSYSQTLAPIFQAVGAVGTFIADTFFAIGKEISEWIGWFEKLTGIEIKPLQGGSDREAIEEEMARRKELEKENEQAQNKAAERAKAMKESLLSPWEQMQQKVDEVYDLEKRGLLTAQERAALEKKITDEFVAQTPAAQALKKAQEDQKKASEEIAAKIKDSAKAGAELGAAADPIRAQFASAAEQIKKDMEAGLISPEAAKEKMSEAVDAMNEELKRLGEDQKFAEKIRDGFKSEMDKVNEELDAIDKNQTLTAAEKEKAKAQVRDKAAASLPGGAEQSPADKFREDQKKLKEAFDKGIIDREQFRERMGNIRGELEDSIADAKDKQERNAGPDRRAVGAVDVNSSEGASTFFRLLRGQDDPTKRQLKEMEKQTRLLANVEQALAEQEVVQI